MSKYEKVPAKFLDYKSVVTYKELTYLLGQLGYIEKKKGKTSGSRVAFVKLDIQHVIRLHKPHPGNELKDYAKKNVVNELRNRNLI